MPWHLIFTALGRYAGLTDADIMGYHTGRPMTLRQLYWRCQAIRELLEAENRTPD